MNASLPPTRTPEVQLWVTLDRVYTRLGRNVLNKLSTFDLTTPQFRVLRQLSQTPRRASELATLLGVTPGNLTGILDRLEDDELLSRERGQDRRSLKVCITPAGEELMRRAVPEMHSHLRGLFSPLSLAELVQMKSLLERLELQLNSPAEEQSA